MTGLAVERGRAEEAFRANRQRELELEEQLRQAAKMEALGVLAGGIAHDFNNVLSTILANAEFARELLTEVVEASKRAGRFCQQMLEYAGRGSHTTARVEMGALILELRNLVQAAVSKKTTLNYELLPEPIHVDGDENQLLQVVMNLVTNAAEAIGDREGRIVVRSELVTYDEQQLAALDPQAKLSAGQYLRLSVSDDGCGMDAETLARIFDPFYTTKFTGRGLGLSAVRGIIGQHAGTIMIDTVLGQGTTFRVLLPTVAQAAAVDTQAASPRPEAGPGRILIAEDEPSLRRILCRRLEYAGFDVLPAADGQEAVDIFNEHGDSIDCVLLDYSMPRLSGMEVREELHAQHSELPIILMSGFSAQDIESRVTTPGAITILEKPVEHETVLEAIHDAIGAPA